MTEANKATGDADGQVVVKKTNILKLCESISPNKRKLVLESAVKDHQGQNLTFG